MSPMIGESLSVIIQEENAQRILLMSSHKQWSSPMSATYENQALVHTGVIVGDNLLLGDVIERLRRKRLKTVYFQM